MKTRHVSTSVLGLIAMAMCQGSNCYRQPALEPSGDTNVFVTVILRNAAERAVHLITLNERANDSNLVQPGGTRTVDVDVTAMTLGVVAFGPGNPLSIGAIECTISEYVNGELTTTGVEIVWTAVGPSGFECRRGG